MNVLEIPFNKFLGLQKAYTDDNPMQITTTWAVWESS